MMIMAQIHDMKENLFFFLRAKFFASADSS